jgi:hypothetical protein
MIGLVIFFAAVHFYFNPAKRYLSVLLLFSLVTALFQIMPLKLMLIPGVSKPYDWVFLFCAFVMLFKPDHFLNLQVWKRHAVILSFFFYLAVLFFYSVDYRGVELSITLRVARNFMFFIILFVFIPLELDDYKKIFRVIVYATAFASILYSIQPFIGTSVLNFLVTEDGKFITESGILRYYNYPVYLFPVIFFFFYKENFLNLKYPKVLAFIVFMAILITQFRNMIAGMIGAYLLFLYLNKRLTIGTIVISCVAAIGVFFIADSALDGRFSKGIADLSKGKFSTSRSAVNSIDQDELRMMSTSEFRWYYTVERIYYLLEDKTRFYLGIGMANEDSQITNKLSFVVGPPKGEDYTNLHVNQIDTGDIAWTLLMLQLGFIGTLLFVFVYLDILKKFFAFKSDSIMQIGIQYILYLFIASFYITDLLASYDICLLMLFVSYAYKLHLTSKQPATADVYTTGLSYPLSPGLM